MGRLIDIENIDYVRLEDSLHCLEHHKGDEVECVICAPTVEAIPKDQYKADLVTMLTELKTEIAIMSDTVVEDRTITVTSWKGMQKRICDFIQSEIDKLKENTDGME